MGKGQGGGVKQSWKGLHFRDDKMMDQGLGGVNMNLDVYDSDDWLVINNEASTRVRNEQRVSPNQTYRACGQPAMLGRGGVRGHDHVSGSNFRHRGTGFVGRPPRFVNFGQNDRVIEKLGGQPPLKPGWGIDLRGGYYDEMGLMHGGCDRPIVVIDSSDEEKEDDVDSSGRKSEYVIKGQAPAKCVLQGLPSDSWAHTGVVPRPYYCWVNAPSDVVHPGLANNGGRPAGRGVMSQPATCPPPSSRNGENLATGEMERNFGKNGQNVSKVDCSNDFETEDDDGFSDEGVGWEDDVTQKNCSNQSGDRHYGQVGADPRLLHMWNSAHGVRPQTEASDEGVGREDDVTQKNCSNQSGPRHHGQVGADPRLQHMWNSAHGVRLQTEAASYVDKKETHCNPYPVCGDKSTLSHRANEVLRKQLLLLEARRLNSLPNPHTRERIWPGGSNPIFGDASYKTSVKNGAQEVDILPEAQSSDMDKSTLSHDANKVLRNQLLLLEALRLKSLGNPHTQEGILPGGSNPIFGAASYKTSVKNGGQEVDIFQETQSSDMDKKKAKENGNAYMCDVSINHGTVFPEACTARKTLHPKLQLLMDLAHGARPSETVAARPVVKKEGYCAPSNINGNMSTLSHGAAGVDVKSPETFHLRRLQNLCTRETLLPGGLNPNSGAHSCEKSEKNGGMKEEILSETESSDDYDDDDSQFGDIECDELETRLAVESLQTTKRAEDEKDKKQYGKLQEEESGESTNVCAGQLFPLEAKKVAERSNALISLFEDYKNRVKEVAKLYKFHITSKPEVDTCAAEREQLMKIHEEKLKMKKRHQEEEQLLEKQFAAALRCFVEKQTTPKQTSFDSDSDASCEL